MESLIFKGKINNYLKMPLYMIIVFLLGDMAAFYFNKRLAGILAAIIVVYAIVCFIIYKKCRSKFEISIVDFAVHYGTVQKELLKNFHVPYVLLDSNGKIMWMNESFMEISQKDSTYNKSITTIFPDITKESIEKAKEDKFELHLGLEAKKYRAVIQRLQISPAEKNSEIVSSMEAAEALTAVLFFDETEYQEIKDDISDQKMVMCLLYIDNYDEVFETVENAKQTMLLALIDRKINRYFSNSDAIVRKLEKDKYFIVFQNKYLAAMEEDAFSLVEDIKTIRMGNEIDITVSLGIGLNGAGYAKNAEFAHMAIDLALARGGAQVVVKNGSQVSYYGIHGKEIERNTRVKARVKAQALRELMESRDHVLVMGHKISDIDCLGASIGVYCAAREVGKPVHIILNTITSSMRPLVESFADKGYPEDMFITSDQAMNLLTDKTLVMVVDTNRPSYVESPEILAKSKSVVVIDHHRQAEEVIENPILSYVEPYASSASEMIAEVLQYFSEKITINSTEADCIYAGILIDTNNFLNKTGVRTFEAAAFLRRNGAEATRVRKMLREDMETYKARAEIVRKAEVYKGGFAISICEGARDIESPTVVGAQAANELLNIVGIKASFVLTEFKDKIYVSSRSIDEIDVQSIMSKLGGGGHLNVAGAQIEDSSINTVINRLKDILDEMLEKGEIKL